MSSIAKSTTNIDQSIRERVASLAETDAGAASEMSLISRIGVVCLGCALIAASIGIWLVPTDDPAMYLVKLGASVFMFGFGAIALFFEKDARDPHRVEFDLKKRQLRTFVVDKSGKISRQDEYDLSTFAEISLRNGVLFARDPAKGTVVSVPVQSRMKQAAIRRAMQLA